jgi:hypothetical protein
MFWHNHAIIREYTQSRNPLAAKLDYTYKFHMKILKFIDIIHFNVNSFKLGVYSLQKVLVMLKHQSKGNIVSCIVSAFGLYLNENSDSKCTE